MTGHGYFDKKNKRTGSKITDISVVNRQKVLKKIPFLKKKGIAVWKNIFNTQIAKHIHLLS